MITKEQIKKAAAMWDSKMSWQAIAETLGVEQQELKTACERVAGRGLKDWGGGQARVVGGFTIVRREAPPYQRASVASELGAAVQEGDCIEGVGYAGFVTALRKYLRKRGLTARGVKRLKEKKWDVYVTQIEPTAPAAKGSKGK